jgi:integrase
MTRKPKGTVGVEVNNGRLRLRLPRHIYGGVQKYLYLGLSDTKTNRRIAEAKAAVIEADILFERFDPTLFKYKPPVYPLPPGKLIYIASLTLPELWQQYTEFKSKSLSPSSLRDFKKVANHISRLPTQSLKEGKKIAHHLLDTLTTDSARRTLVQLNACCEWALDRELIDKNPFEGMARRVKVTKNVSINPFTADERDLIINAFEASSYHRPYASFVKFLFLTGCRTSEAVGLQWQHIDPFLSSITFQEVVVEGQRSQTTKTHKVRKFPVNSTLKELLVSLRSEAPQPEAPVFTDGQGNLVNPNNFLRRHWQPVVKGLSISYRPQYNTRHTFITLCLEAQCPIAQVAAWVGNSPEIILRHYAGLTRCNVPDL